MITKEEGERLIYKHDNNIPFTREERSLILQWKIMDTLEKHDGEMSMGELYKELGVVDKL